MVLAFEKPEHVAVHLRATGCCELVLLCTSSLSHEQVLSVAEMNR